MGNKDLEKEVEELKKAVESLIELEKIRISKEISTPKREEPKPKVDKEELKKELSQVPLGELVVYALKHDLIKRLGKGE